MWLVGLDREATIDELSSDPGRDAAREGAQLVLEVALQTADGAREGDGRQPAGVRPDLAAPRELGASVGVTGTSHGLEADRSR